MKTKETIKVVEEIAKKLDEALTALEKKRYNDCSYKIALSKRCLELLALTLSGREESDEKE